MCATFYWIICHQSNVIPIHKMCCALLQPSARMYALSEIICMMTAGDKERILLFRMTLLLQVFNEIAATKQINRKKPHHELIFPVRFFLSPLFFFKLIIFQMLTFTKIVPIQVFNGYLV